MLQRDRETGLPLVPVTPGLAGLGEFDWHFDTPVNSGVSGFGSIDWGDILKTSIQTGAEIAKSRFGGPQPGQYFQDGNRVSYNLGQGIPTLATFPGQSFGGGLNLSNPLLLLGLGVLMVSVLRR